jgi:hypothetical protein
MLAVEATARALRSRVLDGRGREIIDADVTEARQAKQ